MAPEVSVPEAAPSAPELPKDDPFYKTVADTAPAAPTTVAGISSKDVVTKDLGLDAAPLKEGGIPMCIDHFDKVSASPNARWCATCTFRLPCKAKSGMAKKA
jgi:hypothetical protein